MNKLLYPLILIFLLFAFSCRKYDENTVWFKKKEKLQLIFPRAKLTAYKVNGIDSLDALNAYFGWNAIDKNIRDTYFSETYVNFKEAHRITFFFKNSWSSGYIEMNAGYSKNMKEITFGKYSNYTDTAIPFKKFLFIDNSPWEIIKMIPGGEKRIKKTINGNTYELQFEPY